LQWLPAALNCFNVPGTALTSPTNKRQLAERQRTFLCTVPETAFAAVFCRTIFFMAAGAALTSAMNKTLLAEALVGKRQQVNHFIAARNAKATDKRLLAEALVCK